ncbi:hypothetical protein I4U23_017322 [Adineta vaga]|nr:hypothetical protein I4U23_017322 [Adineta vaga]
MVEQEEQRISKNDGNMKKKTKRNFIMICLAYVCAYTSLNAVISLQSSINSDADIGLYSLATLYGSSLITSLFFTTPIGYIFGYKWSIVGGQLGAMIYIAWNIYPKQWLMFLTAGICGIFRACMFMAQEAYVSVLAGGENENNDDDNDIKTKKYFSIFFSAYQSAEICGNLISYLVLRNVSTSTQADVNQCGANFLEKEHKEQETTTSHISPTISFITCTIGVQYVGLIMTMYGVTVTLSSIVVSFIVKRKYSRPKPTSSQTYVLFILPCLSSISTGITESFQNNDRNVRKST